MTFYFIHIVYKALNDGRYTFKFFVVKSSLPAKKSVVSSLFPDGLIKGDSLIIF